MILPEFQYVSVSSVDEACKLLKNYSDEGKKAKIYAGGTDLINFIKAGAIDVDYLVDIKAIPDLDQIAYDPEEGLTIGALTKLRDIELSPIVKEYYPAIAESVHLIASTQIRSKGTLAGNICNASPSADSVPALFVLDAKLVVAGVDGERIIPINEFYKGFKQIDLEAGEIVTAIKVPAMKADQSACYLAHTVRKAMDLAIVGVAANLTINEDVVCQDAKIALGAVAVTCVRADSAEKEIIGKKITLEAAAEAGLKAMEDCNPISDVRASAEYRHDMVRVFTKRAIMKALERKMEVK